MARALTTPGLAKCEQMKVPCRHHMRVSLGHQHFGQSQWASFASGPTSRTTPGGGPTSRTSAQHGGLISEERTWRQNTPRKLPARTRLPQQGAAPPRVRAGSSDIRSRRSWRTLRCPRRPSHTSSKARWNKRQEAGHQPRAAASRQAGLAKGPAGRGLESTIRKLSSASSAWNRRSGNCRPVEGIDDQETVVPF